jgi:hypothetical protein
MAATCGLLLHASASTTPALANNADLFFDFSSKIRVGSTATSTVDDDGKSRPTIDSEVGEAEAQEDISSAFGHTSSSSEEEADVSEEVAEALAEIEDLLAQLVTEMTGYDSMEDSKGGGDSMIHANLTTENLLSLSVQVPANATAAEWASAYGDMISNEQEGYYNAEASGYIT